MVSLSQVQASNGRIEKGFVPRTAVFIGGTAGIGKATLSALVALGTPIKVYIIGRNEASRKSWLESLQKTNSNAEIIWLEGQITLLAEAKRLADDIKKRESNIDLLFLSAGFLPFTGRQETSEGFETSLALLYWSRILFIQEMLGLMNSTSSTRQTYNPRVISIAGPGFENPEIDLDDLDLRKPESFGTFQFVKQVSTLTTLSLDHLAVEPANHDVVFIHNQPGGVKTDVFKNGWGGKPIDYSLVPPAVLNGMSPETAGERCLYLITSAQFGGKGVPLQEDIAAGLTVAKTESGALFCVNDQIETIQQEDVLKQLKSRNADAIIWKKTQDALAPYI